VVRTVQGALEDALAQILQKPTSLLAAGRTDSGVHAVGQVVAFGADWKHPLADLQRALNAVLPDDVAVRALAPAPAGFHPRYDALSRTYCYAIWNHRLKSPLLRRTTLWVRRPLNLELMNEAAQLIVGSHDFHTFGTAPRATRARCARKRARETRPTTVRQVVRATWSRVDERHLLRWQRALLGGPAMGTGSDELLVPEFTEHGSQWQGLVEFTVEANAFLYRMVRSIVGTLIQVGYEDLSVAEFASALDGADRALAGPTAAPQGLCLIGVQYGADAGR
jgi:tRNA pseudouridine38-40 synthase